MKIGIIGAMELEVAALKQELTQASCCEVAGMKFFDGMLEQASVVVVQCGVGKVNAAICVQILHDLFKVTHVINTGVAGGLNDKLDIGDILICTGTGSGTGYPFLPGRRENEAGCHCLL